MNGDGNSNRNLLQQGWRGWPEDSIELIGLPLKLVLGGRRFARQLRRHLFLSKASTIWLANLSRLSGANPGMTLHMVLTAPTPSPLRGEWIPARDRSR